MSLTLVQFTPNTRIKSSEVNSNFNALNGELFDLDENNFNLATQFPDSFFAEITSPNKVNGSAIRAETIDAVKGQFIWTIAGNLTQSASQSFPLRPSATELTVTGVYLEVTVAPVGGPITVDINKDGISIFSTRPEIQEFQFTGGSGAILTASPYTLALNNKLTIDLDAVGTSIPGANLVVYLRCKQKVPQ